METELVGLKNIEILAQTKQVLKLKNLQVCFVWIVYQVFFF